MSLQPFLHNNFLFSHILNFCGFSHLYHGIYISIYIYIIYICGIIFCGCGLSYFVVIVCGLFALPVHHFYCQLYISYLLYIVQPSHLQLLNQLNISIFQLHFSNAFIISIIHLIYHNTLFHKYSSIYSLQHFCVTTPMYSLHWIYHLFIICLYFMLQPFH